MIDALRRAFANVTLNSLLLGFLHRDWSWGGALMPLPLRERNPAVMTTPQHDPDGPSTDPQLNLS